MSSLKVAETIGDAPGLCNALDRFCLEHTHVESSALVSVVQAEIASSADINAAALAPLRHAIFGFDAALKWGFFLHTVTPDILAENGKTLPKPFDVAQYLTELTAIYDQAVERMVWDFCEEDDEDDEEDEEDETND